MATFVSDLVTNLAARPVTSPQGAGQMIAQQATASVPVTHAASDLVKLNVLPAGCVPTNFICVIDELDTNASDTLTYSVGVLNSGATDLVASTEFISAAKTPTPTVQQMNSVNAIRNIGVSTSDRIIALKITNVAATKAAGSVTGVLSYRTAEYGA